ncbi:hypothetical protein CBOM_05342 [Ceraceosorus bombacis]|uniref:Uncharacterized protein n=1 Tax=Ceraceosorus bombacis TaxID=401625 RepID=A0A0P1BP82_9BASI|nr:hypothetical protein CBOM_05342 [Ceraceosorus bombacis]
MNEELTYRSTSHDQNADSQEEDCEEQGAADPSASQSSWTGSTNTTEITSHTNSTVTVECNDLASLQATISQTARGGEPIPRFPYALQKAFQSSCPPQAKAQYKGHGPALLHPPRPDGARAGEHPH